MTNPTFQRGLVATRYLLGVRGDGLRRDLPSPAEASVERLLRRLAVGDRAGRAAALAPELARVAAAADALRLTTVG